MTAPARRWRRPLAAAVLLAAALLATALLAAAAARAQQLPLRGYGQLDGLANLSVSALAQDRAGYLWVGTENGLYRFDGARLRRHPLGRDGADGTIAALHVDPAGRLWVGTDHGLFLLQGGHALPVRRVDGKPLPVRPGQHLVSIDAGHLLVQSDGRLHRVQADGRGGWHAVQPLAAAHIAEIDAFQAWPTGTAAELAAYRAARPPLGDLNGVLRDPDGTLWLGCKLSLCRYRDGALVVLGAADGLPARRWTGLLRDRAGALWLSAGDRVMMRAPGAARFRDLTPAGHGGAAGGMATALLEDGDGRLLLLSDHGLFRGGAGGWRRYGARQGLHVTQGNHALLRDSDGDLWLGLPGRGLARWQGYRHWENWTPAQGLPDENVWSIARAGDGALYLGTGRGLAALGDTGAAPVAAGGGRPWSALAVDARGALWGADFTGRLFRRGRRGRAVEVARLPELVVYHMLFDRAGRLWLCTEGGLYVIADPRRAATPARVEPAMALAGADAGFLGACGDAAGRLWFAGTGGVLWLADGRWSRALAPGDGGGFSSIACDGDTLWLVGAAGARLSRAAASAGALAPRPVEHALLEGRAPVSMLVDRRHWLWLGTDNGLLVWNGSRWRLFNEQSGLAWNDSNQHALYEDHDGSLWIGTSNGLSHLLRPETLFAPRAVPLYVEAARYGGAALAGAGMPWNGGALEVRLAAPLLQNHEALSYRYRLAGQEQAWSTSDNGALRYAALAPGEYRLQVVAEHAMTQATSAMLELPLTIAPPWWRTRWADAGGALLALGLAGLLHRYRVARVLRQRALLERRVAERTAELEASREEHRLRSLKDGLTGAWNRTALMERLAPLLAPGAAPFLLVLLDLDHFKRVNDTHGHLAGDAVLREMVRRIQARLRASDTVGRYGGEEFMLLLPGLDLAGGGPRLARLHRQVCATPVDIDGVGPLPVTCSGGVVVGRAERGLTAEQWIALADQALYRAKALGRDRLEYAPAGAA